MLTRDQRILDPINGLIAFNHEDETDALVWTLLDYAPLQRLRRIKQLGFAEFVFPGATHSRFSHSIGVFHMARRLTKVIQRQLGKEFNSRRACAAQIAALLHDLGHGPFSHAFEKSEEKRLGGQQKPHEDWTIDIIQNDPDIARALNQQGLMQEIIEMISPKSPSQNDLYTSIVSSQFDADRLDYLRRDRYMSGIGSGGFDCDWLLDCLEVSQDGAFCLNHKSAHNAEEYLLARYNLYILVYTHKTNRAAEMMLAEILYDLACHPQQSGLAVDHPLRRYYERGSCAAYLALDDMVIWHALGEMAQKAENQRLRDLSKAIMTRKFYKAFDVGQAAEEDGRENSQEDKLQEFLSRIQQETHDFLIDQAEITAYGIDRSDSVPIKINPQEKGDARDIAETSKIVASIPKKKLCRIYADEQHIERARKLWQEMA